MKASTKVVPPSNIDWHSLAPLTQRILKQLPEEINEYAKLCNQDKNEELVFIEQCIHPFFEELSKKFGSQYVPLLLVMLLRYYKNTQNQFIMLVVEWLSQNPPGSPYFGEETVNQVKSSSTDIGYILNQLNGDSESDPNATRSVTSNSSKGSFRNQDRADNRYQGGQGGNRGRGYTNKKPHRK